MATPTQIQQTVLAYFQKNWPNATTSYNFTADMGLDPRQLLDMGTELAEELNCWPTRSQILACKTIGDLINLLIKTNQPPAKTQTRAKAGKPTKTKTP